MVINLGRATTIFSLFTICYSFQSCSNKPDPKPSQGQGGPGIYFAGVGEGSTGISSAMYWKNGISFNLSYDRYSQSIANYITVSGNDVYVAGSTWSGATYWKNGAETFLTSTWNATANSIFIQGKDIYIAGTIPYGTDGNVYAVYWKNDQLIQFTEPDSRTIASSIAVAGDDVYITGYVYQQNTNSSTAVYWKNGNMVALTDGPGEAYAGPITVYGVDVYFTVFEAYGSTSLAKYWKNGEMIVLTDGTTSCKANAITVSGGDVYVAGTMNGISSDRGVITYWKNGQPVNNLADTSKIIWPTGIAVDGNDVYISGYVTLIDSSNMTATTKAQYWKNGVLMDLQNGGIGKTTDYTSAVVAVK